MAARSRRSAGIASGLAAPILAALLALLSGCRNIQPGAFKISFQWAGGVAPSFSQPVYAFGRIEDHSRTPYQILYQTESGAGVKYPGGDELTFGNIPPGSSRVAYVEMREQNDLSSQIRYFGISKPFDLTVPGYNYGTQQVLVQLTPAPGIASASSIQVQAPVTQGYVNSEDVELLLSTDSGQFVSLANLQVNLNSTSSAQLLAGLQKQDGQLVYPQWTLDTTAADIDGCDVATAPTGCPVYVFAQFSVKNDQYIVTSPVTYASVTVDKVPPALKAVTITPPYSTVSETITATVTPSEPLVRLTPHVALAAAPSSEIPDFLTPDPDTQNTFIHEVTAADANGSYVVTFDLVDLAGNQTSAVGPSPPATFEIDRIAPVIATPTISGGYQDERFSAQSGFNVVSVTFTANKVLDSVGSSYTVTVGGYASQAPCTATGAPPSVMYSCLYTVQGTETSGGTAISLLSEATMPIAVTAVDEAGNRGTAPPAAVTFDFKPPALDSASAIPALPAVAGLGETVQLLIAPSEALSGAGVSIAVGGLPAPAFAYKSGTSYAFTRTITASDPSNTYAVTVSMTDLVGNPAEALAGPSFRVDTVAPEISAPVITGGYQDERFSAERGFNVVSVGFTANKALDAAGSTYTVTIGGYPPQTPCTSTGAPPSVAYSCLYAVQGTETSGGTAISLLSEATMPVAVTAIDESGNEGTAPPAAVTFDFLPPTLDSASAIPGLPAVAGLSETVQLLIAPSEALSAAGVSVAVAGLPAPAFAYKSSTSYEFSRTITASDPSNTYAALVSMTDLVGNPAVGLAGPSFQIDTVPPELSLPVITGGYQNERFSAQAGFNTVGIQFTANKLVASGGSILTVTVGGYPPQTSCSHTGAAPSVTYSCLYTVQGDETSGGTPISQLPEATAPVVVTATDEAGNQAIAPAAAVIFDFAPPALSGPPSLQLLPAPNQFTSVAPPDPCAGATNVLSAVTAATACTDIRVTVALTEQLSGPPVVVSSPAGFSYAISSASGTSYVCDGTYQPAATLTAGSYGLSITATDVVGNMATLTPGSPLVSVLTSAPASPSSVAGGPMTYTRIPQGSAADSRSNGLPLFNVTGAAGSAQGPGTIVIYDEVDPRFRSVLGQGPINTTGAFNVNLVRADHNVVYAAVADPAGNLSPAVAVHNVEWIITFLNKVSGNPFSNRSVVETVQSLDLAGTDGGFAGTLVTDPNNTVEATSYVGLTGAGDGQILSTATATTWKQQGIAVTAPPMLEGQAMSYDAARGVHVVFGGSNGVQATHDTWSWNGSSWTNVSPPLVFPSARIGAAMTYDAALGVVVLFGGGDGTTDITAGDNSSLGDTWTWDGSSWSNVTPVGLNPPARSYAAMAYDSARGVVVMFGGFPTGGSIASAYLNDTWEWNGSSWKSVTPSAAQRTVGPPNRLGGAMAYDPARQVTVLFGGLTHAIYQSTAVALGDTWTWNGSTWTNVTPPGTSPAARSGHSLAYDGARGQTVLFGGGFADTWTWSGTAWTNATPASTNPASRKYQSMAYDAGRSVTILTGGTGASLFGDTWEWNGAAWLNVTPSVANPTPRDQHTMAFDSSTGTTLLFGGELSTGSPLGDTWKWDGSRWTSLSPGMSPPQRYAHAMVYDSGHASIVLFGGNDGATTGWLNDTWSWNGTSWTNVTPAGTSPSARSLHAMTYDPARRQTLLLGGYSQIQVTPDGGAPIVVGSIVGDLWAWNGSIWTGLSPTGSVPARRFGHALAYDASREVTVLFGGCSSIDATLVDTTYSCAGWLNDTWEWNGSSWTQRTSNGAAGSPPARTQHILVYDPTLGRTILFGGGGSGGLLNDTWTWDGTSWLNVTQAGSSPSARDGHAGAYDSTHTEVVVFGGSIGTPLDDTLLASSSPDARPAQLAQFFSPIGGTSAQEIQQMTFRATAGGTGYSLAVPGSGVATSGAILAVWDAWSGSWTQLATNTASPASPSALTYVTASAAEAARYLYDPLNQQTVNVAVFPSSTRGNGAQPSQLAVDYLDLTVTYQPQEEDCTAAPCVCSVIENVCGTQCTDLSMDPNNCGSCGSSCPQGIACVAGACQCPAGQVDCSGVCTVLATDPGNCGTCGFQCSDGSSCVNGLCVCLSGYTACTATTCDNVKTNPLQCGQCGHNCLEYANVSAANCASGSCVIEACAPGYANCDGVYTDGCETNVSTNASNCGQCGNACNGPNMAYHGCSGGQCTGACITGWGDCDNTLEDGCETNLNTTANHCGTCQFGCDAGSSCVNGTCH